MDRIRRIDWNREITVVKATTATEEVYDEHFHGFPVLPGALQIEAMAQACGAMLEICSGYTCFSILLMVEKMKFRRMVHPGDQMLITATVYQDHEDSAQFDVRVEVDGQSVSGGRMTVGKVHAGSSDYRETFAGLEAYYRFPLKDAVITGKPEAGV